MIFTLWNKNHITRYGKKTTLSTKYRSSYRKCSVKKVFAIKIPQNSQENTCARDSFSVRLQVYNFIRKESLAQLVSCEFCEISKNTVFTEHLQTTASENTWNWPLPSHFCNIYDFGAGKNYIISCRGLPLT